MPSAFTPPPVDVELRIVAALRGRNARQLAAATGIAYGRTARILTGQRRPTPEELVALRLALAQDPDR